MSYIGSARKHGINAFTAIREALNGNPDIILINGVLNRYKNFNIIYILLLAYHDFLNNYRGKIDLFRHCNSSVPTR